MMGDIVIMFSVLFIYFYFFMMYICTQIIVRINLKIANHYQT